MYEYWKRQKEKERMKEYWKRQKEKERMKEYWKRQKEKERMKEYWKRQKEKERMKEYWKRQKEKERMYEHWKRQKKKERMKEYWKRQKEKERMKEYWKRQKEKERMKEYWKRQKEKERMKEYWKRRKEKEKTKKRNAKTSAPVEENPPRRGDSEPAERPDPQGLAGRNLKEIWDVKEKKLPEIVIGSRIRKNFREISKDIKMAIDLPETIPSIINSFRRSNSAKTLQKLTKNLKSYEKGSRFSFLWPKSCRNEQCKCSFANCKDCQNKLNGASECSGNECKVKSAYITCQNFDSNVESEVDADCEQTLLNGLDVKPDLNFENVYNWNLRENEVDTFPNKFWKGKNSGNSKFFSSERQDDEALLNSPSEIRKRKKRVFFLSSLGVALISIAIFIRLFDPLEKILNWKLNLAPGTFVLDLWLAPPVTVYVKIYIFNFTNPKEFLAGKEKMKVQQLGPYVYTEHLENTNPVFNANGTLSYIPRRTVKYSPKFSVADPKLEKIIVPNIPFLGISSMIAESSVFTNLGFVTLTKYLGSEPFLNLTVHDYLWGYSDPLVKLANKMLSTKIPFSNFGLLDRMYDEGDNIITIRLNDNGLNVTDKGYLPKYTIDTWNGSPGLTAWGYKPGDFKADNLTGPVRPEPNERCKLIRGASDGVIFPRNMSPKIVHQVYRKTFCRIIPLVFEKEGISKNGIPAYWYKLPETVFDTPDVNPEQACYCNPNTTKCLPKGLSDITPCYYDIPAAVSFPHFLGADPKLLEKIEGLSPNKEEHGTNIILQPNLGMPMEFQTRIQTNIIMKKIRYNSRIAAFSEMAVPIVWIELAVDGLPGYINFLLYLVVFVVPGLLTAFIVICSIAGVSLLIFSAVTVLTLAGVIQINTSKKTVYSSLKIAPMLNRKSLVKISKKNSIMSAFAAGRKNSVISIHKNFSNI